MPAIDCSASREVIFFLGKRATHDARPLTMRRLRPFILIIVILAAWETAARSGLWSPLLFPSLDRIGHEFWLFVSRPEGWWQTWTSPYRAFGGFAPAALGGVPLGLLMGRPAFVPWPPAPLF